MEKKINDYDFYNDEKSLFYKVVNTYKSFDELPNLLVNGKNGCGKKSRVYTILSNITNSSIYKKEYIEIDNKIKYFKSEYHVEFDLNHYNLNDKCIIDNFLKDFCESRNIGFDIPKIVIFLNAQLLSKISQYMLRRIIEKNTNNVRFILITNNLNKLLDPIKSRFMLLRIPSPKKDILLNIIKNEDKEKKLKKSDINKIIESSDSNINKILQNIKLINKGLNIIENYKKELDKIYDLITSNKYNLKKYYSIRTIIYDLYTDNNNEFVMFEYLYKKFINDKKFDQNTKIDFIKDCAILNHKMSIGNKEPLYLERLINTIVLYNLK